MGMSWKTVLGIGITLIAVSFSVFQLWVSSVGALATLQQNYTHLGFALVLVFLTRPAFKETSRFANIRWLVDAPLIFGSVVMAVYMVIHFLDIADRGAGDPTQVGIVLGIVTTVAVIEGTRRMVGLALPLLAITALIYAFAGPHLPGILAHRGFDYERVSATLYLTTAGIAGTPLQVSASFVAIFVIFAAFLDVSGAGKFFIDWSYAALGWLRGGPAKVAIFASALMGTVSGSAVANTAATGAFTIPIMKKTGLRPAFAGAVEAAASSGGQIMPPVMGAAAFIMVEIMGEPYTAIMKAAIMPGILYFLGVFCMVDFEVAKMGIKGVPRSELPNAFNVFKTGWHLIIPLGVLLYLLFIVEYTPLKSGFGAIIAVGSVVLAATLLRRLAADGWNPVKAFVPHALDMLKAGWDWVTTALRRGGMSMLEVAMACACAGVIIGVLMLTGLALRLSSIMIEISGGQLFPLMMVTMFVSIILGMGLPTSAVYVVLAILVVPAMVQIGVDLMAAHMFVFYFGVLANVTPPVAIAAYTGAGIAGADPTRTGLIAFRIALAGFVLPFMWVYNPALILKGELPEILLAIVTSIAGIVSLASAAQGYLFGTGARWYLRIFMGGAALSLIMPDLTTDLVGAGLLATALAIRFLVPGQVQKVKDVPQGVSGEQD
jgi:TRAP transporter 4TM/12TM fusion protein